MDCNDHQCMVLYIQVLRCRCRTEIGVGPERVSNDSRTRYWAIDSGSLISAKAIIEECLFRMPRAF